MKYTTDKKTIISENFSTLKKDLTFVFFFFRLKLMIGIYLHLKYNTKSRAEITYSPSDI